MLHSPPVLFIHVLSLFLIHLSLMCSFLVNRMLILSCSIQCILGYISFLCALIDICSSTVKVQYKSIKERVLSNRIDEESLVGGKTGTR